MKKTRILSLAMTGALCLSLLAGCGGGNSGTAETPAAGASETPAAQHTSTATRPAINIGRTRPQTRAPPNNKTSRTV